MISLSEKLLFFSLGEATKKKQQQQYFRDPTKRTRVSVSHSVNKHYKYFTRKQRCWCEAPGLASAVETQRAAAATRLSVSGRMFRSQSVHSKHPPTPRTVSSSSAAALAVPPRQQPQAWFTDGPLERQRSWSSCRTHRAHHRLLC